MGFWPFYPFVMQLDSTSATSGSSTEIHLEGKREKKDMMTFCLPACTTQAPWLLQASGLDYYRIDYFRMELFIKRGLGCC